MPTVRLPWPASGLSPNARLHRMAVAKLKRKARWEAKVECLVAGVRRIEADAIDVRVTFHPPSRRAFDTDNLVARCKSAIDGIADAVGVDDSRWRMIFERGEPIKGGAMIVEIAAP